MHSLEFGRLGGNSSFYSISGNSASGPVVYGQPMPNKWTLKGKTKGKSGSSISLSKRVICGILFGKGDSTSDLRSWASSNRGNIILIQSGLERHVTHNIPLSDTNALLARMWAQRCPVWTFHFNFFYYNTTEEISKPCCIRVKRATFECHQFWKTWQWVCCNN